MQNTQAINVTAGNATAIGSVTVSDNMPGVPCPDPAGYKYVGARYVPLFADPAEWSSANTYEPLTIVVNQGNSYTSRQFVPVGIDISNTEYWALTGNYNAQVEQYRQEVEQVKQEVEQVKQEIAQVNEEIDKINTPKKLLVIGDSFSNTVLSDGPAWWVSYAQAKNLTPYSAAVDGAGFTTGRTFITQWNSLKTNHNLESVAEIIIYGGVNDIASKADYDAVISAMDFLYSTIASDVADYNIIVTYALNEGYSSHGIELYSYGYMMYTHAMNNGIRTLNDSWKWLLSTPNTIMKSNNHPTSVGMKRISEYMLGGIQQPIAFDAVRNDITGLTIVEEINIEFLRSNQSPGEGIDVSSYGALSHFISGNMLYVKGWFTINNELATAKCSKIAVTIPNGFAGFWDNNSFTLLNANTVFRPSMFFQGGSGAEAQALRKTRIGLYLLNVPDLNSFWIENNNASFSLSIDISV